MSEDNGNAVTLAGGEEIDVTIGGKRKKVFVRQLPIEDIPKLAQATGENNGFGDESTMVRLYLGEGQLDDLSVLDMDAIGAILDKGEELNLRFLHQFLRRQQRRGKVFQSLGETEKPSSKSQPKSRG